MAEILSGVAGHSAISRVRVAMSGEAMLDDLVDGVGGFADGAGEVDNEGAVRGGPLPGPYQTCSSDHGAARAHGSGPAFWREKSAVRHRWRDSAGKIQSDLTSRRLSRDPRANVREVTQWLTGRSDPADSARPAIGLHRASSAPGR